MDEYFHFNDPAKGKAKTDFHVVKLNFIITLGYEY